MGSASHKTVRARNHSAEIAATSTTFSDTPQLPVAELERLATFAPDRVDWVFDQTELEANFRRSEHKRINTLVFIERICGLVFAFLVTGMGLGAAIYCAIIGQPWLGGVIGGGTLATIVWAFISGRRSPPA